jgi:hypothetical protein
VIDALKSEVLPYLEEAKNAFPKGTFGYRRHNDPDTKRLDSVSFQVDGFDTVEIKDQSGRVAIRKMGVTSQSNGIRS